VRVAKGMPSDPGNFQLLARGPRCRLKRLCRRLAALCPFTANYAAVPLTKVLTIFLTTFAVLIFLHPSAYQLDLIPKRANLLRSVPTWFLGGLVVGLGTLVHSFVQKLLCSSCLSCLSIGCAGGGY
jgi:hypothetical protein